MFQIGFKNPLIIMVGKACQYKVQMYVYNIGDKSIEYNTTIAN